jgi:hypothetical protein
MSITRPITLPFLLTALLGICTMTLAQPIPEAQRKYSRFSNPDISTEESVEIETAITTRIEIPGIEIVPCQAQVELAYYQRNTLARVEAIISNKRCNVVNGSFEVVASMRDDNGELTSHTFTESFALEGEERTEFSRDYPIGEKVTLSSVRSRNVACECLDQNEAGNISKPDTTD